MQSPSAAHRGVTPRSEYLPLKFEDYYRQFRGDLERIQRSQALDIVATLRLAAGGQAPASAEGWQETAHRLGCDLYVMDGLGARQGAVLDDVIVIRDSGCPVELARRASHELAEFLLASEWENPVNSPGMTTDEYRHGVARIVEEEIAAEIRARSGGDALETGG
jgi:hypothetical protein